MLLQGHHVPAILRAAHANGDRCRRWGPRRDGDEDDDGGWGGSGDRVLMLDVLHCDAPSHDCPWFIWAGAFPLVYSLTSDMTTPDQRALASSAVSIGEADL
jgi:hypothetical protein